MSGARERVNEMITGCWRTQVIHEAVKLGLPEHLAAGQGNSDALAHSLGVDADGLYRLLCGLAALGLATHVGDHQFELTDDGATLCASHPQSLRGVALHWGERQWKSFGLLGKAIETGKSQMQAGSAGFIDLQKDATQAEVFNRAMAEQSLRIGEAAARAYDFSHFEAVLDVGGGFGAVLVALLQAVPRLRGDSFDLPEVADGAYAYLSNSGVGDRAGFVGGSFFDEVPGGYDCHVLKYIVHDWDDAHSIRLLSRCAAALAPGGVLLLLEQVLPERITPEPGVAGMVRGDLIMLNIGGRERTATQYQALLAAAGLRLTRIVPTDTVFSLIEAKPR
jgi:SAM-dependent methyltransferase